ncbi:MAG: hypothetical protein HY699_21290 [Deltaproteobacteria bacterium]|nr:hypothetical protein [Deltaproteobacteria bacterium]
MRRAVPVVAILMWLMAALMPAPSHGNGQPPCGQAESPTCDGSCDPGLECVPAPELLTQQQGGAAENGYSLCECRQVAEQGITHTLADHQR